MSHSDTQTSAVADGGWGWMNTRIHSVWSYNHHDVITQVMEGTEGPQ